MPESTVTCLIIWVIIAARFLFLPNTLIIPKPKKNEQFWKMTHLPLLAFFPSEVCQGMKRHVPSYLVMDTCVKTSFCPQVVIALNFCIKKVNFLQNFLSFRIPDNAHILASITYCAQNQQIMSSSSDAVFLWNMMSLAILYFPLLFCLS